MILLIAAKAKPIFVSTIWQLKLRALLTVRLLCGSKGSRVYGTVLLGVLMFYKSIKKPITNTNSISESLTNHWHIKVREAGIVKRSEME